MWVQAVDHLEHVNRGLESAQVLDTRGGAARFANVEDIERAFHGHIVDGLKPLSFPKGTYDENLEHAEEAGGHGDTDLRRRDFYHSIWGGENWYVRDELLKDIVERLFFMITVIATPTCYAYGNHSV
jgi:hypothetical protein